MIDRVSLDECRSRLDSFLPVHHLSWSLRVCIPVNYNDEIPFFFFPERFLRHILSTSCFYYIKTEIGTKLDLQLENELSPQ